MSVKGLPGAPTGRSFEGRWFDGRMSQARTVRATLSPGRRGPQLTLHSTAGETLGSFTHDQIGWPERWGAARPPPRITVDLRDQGSLEIDDVTGWHEALLAAGGKPALAERMQNHWPVFVGVLVMAGGALFGFYRWGTPWAATQLTRQVPITWETTLAENALRSMDGQMLKASKLPPERQAQLRARFDELVQRLDPALRRYPAYVPRLTLSFRSGMGPNAFALPGGTIVMTDELVTLAARQGLPDEALVGVLAHEIGHVVHRHTTRMVVEQGVLNVGLGLALGDVSNVLSIGSSLLTGLAYRRQHETEADCFAVALMQRAQLPTVPMADLLIALGSARPPREARPSASAPAPAQKPEPASAKAEAGWTSLLASHPQTPQRALALRQGDVSACR